MRHYQDALKLKAVGQNCAMMMHHHCWMHKNWTESLPIYTSTVIC